MATAKETVTGLRRSVAQYEYAKMATDMLHVEFEKQFPDDVVAPVVNVNGWTGIAMIREDGTVVRVELYVKVRS